MADSVGGRPRGYGTTRTARPDPQPDGRENDMVWPMGEGGGTKPGDATCAAVGVRPSTGSSGSSVASSPLPKAMPHSNPDASSANSNPATVTNTGRAGSTRVPHDAGDTAVMTGVAYDRAVADGADH